MTYRIVWGLKVLQRFTAAWEQLDRETKRAVENALDEVDILLSVMPKPVGESRNTETRRILLHLPIVVEYRVDDDRRIVFIVAARIARTPPS